MPVQLVFANFNSSPQTRTIPDATTAAAGVMSAADKNTLNNLASSALNTAITTKNLTDNVASTIVNVDFTKVPDNNIGFLVFFTVEANDATDTQARTGYVRAAAVVKSGAYNTSAAETSTVATTVGSLTLTFAWSTSGTTASLQVTPASSLTPTALAITYYIPFTAHPAAVSIP